ncbi:MAG: methylated-DNA--[protein]-cysteine S-methyltransferase [Gammaproteobacteria bacterium]
MSQIILATPIGKLAIEYEQDFVLKVMQIASQSRIKSNRDYFAKEIQKQVGAYFSGELEKFDIPFLFSNGTDFQVRVWDQIRKIPFGTTKTYGEIANKLKSGPRAVGNACRRNHLLLIVPCHRVVSTTGLGGFMGDVDGSLVKRKQWLLSHELEYCHAA